MSNVLTLSLCVAQLLHSLHIASHTQRRWICCQSRHLLLLHSHPALLILVETIWELLASRSRILAHSLHSHTLTALSHCVSILIPSHCFSTVPLPLSSHTTSALSHCLHSTDLTRHWVHTGTTSSHHSHDTLGLTLSNWPYNAVPLPLSSHTASALCHCLCLLTLARLCTVTLVVVALVLHCCTGSA